MSGTSGRHPSRGKGDAVSQYLKKLIHIGSDPTSGRPFDPARLSGLGGGTEQRELARLLEGKNGFYAFEGALHVLSDSSEASEVSLVAWNERGLWKNDYQGMADNGVFFAEDIFGVQFVLRGADVFTFDPETGQSEAMASDLEEWAKNILEDWNLWTGYQIAHDWQLEHGRIREGLRLSPVTPFVLGGAYSVANMRAVNAVEGMKFRASIAVQIKDLPDGATVKLSVVE